MDLLFNNNGAGQAEIKSTLGFINADFTYANLEPDIILYTPDLIDIIGQDVYDKIQAFYTSTDTDADTKTALQYCQLYIASMAYLAYAPNNDLSHSNSGRSFRNEENEKIPWDWQIKKDNKATAKRGFKALDRLLLLLDKLEWTEWTESEAYQTANELFIKNTNQFDKAFYIDKSGQLYYRLVPFMEDFEIDEIIPIITADKAEELKTAATPDANQKQLLSLIRKAVAYLSLGKGLKAFPVEMFPKSLNYQEKEIDQSLARAEVMQFMDEEGKRYLQKIENVYQQQIQTYTERKLTNGLEKGKKYVNL